MAVALTQAVARNSASSVVVRNIIQMRSALIVPMEQVHHVTPIVKPEPDDIGELMLRMLNS
jgi:hypothetical protein